MKALLAVEVGVAEERAPGPGEGHDGQRHGDRNIHANLDIVNGSRIGTTILIRHDDRGGGGGG